MGDGCREDSDATVETLLCRCREVSEADVIAAIGAGARCLRGVKIRTRAGTGLCQGGTCGPIIERILRRELGSAAEAGDRRERGPTRALTVEALADSHADT